MVAVKDVAGEMPGMYDYLRVGCASCVDLAPVDLGRFQVLSGSRR